MTKVYVVGASIPAGGPYMAYHIGRILHKEWGYDFMDVQVRPITHSIFKYDIPMQPISLADLEKYITDNDILIANPIFSSNLFGLRLKCRKLMYIQGYYGYHYLDCHFDTYACVSTAVQQYVNAIYAFSPRIIPPFIEIAPTTDIPAWEERNPFSFFIYQKFYTPEHDFLLKQICNFISAHFPYATMDVVVHKTIPQAEFFQRIKKCRYFINISIGEGFGLAPLEAMALGCMVMGLDGVGGRDYMKHGENCLTYAFKDWNSIFASLREIVKNDIRAKTIVESGRITALYYNYDNFLNHWKAIIKESTQ